MSHFMQFGAFERKLLRGFQWITLSLFRAF